MREYGNYGPETAWDIDSMPGGSSFNVRDREFKRDTFAVTRVLPVDAYRSYTDELNIGMKVDLTAYIYYESMGVYTHTWTYPTTWWDHFKQECFPKWLLAKYPAKYTTESIELDAKAIFPDWNPPRGYTEHRYIIREIVRG